MALVARSLHGGGSEVCWGVHNGNVQQFFFDNLDDKIMVIWVCISNSTKAKNQRKYMCSDIHKWLTYDSRDANVR